MMDSVQIGMQPPHDLSVSERLMFQGYCKSLWRMHHAFIFFRAHVHDSVLKSRCNQFYFTSLMHVHGLIAHKSLLPVFFPFFFLIMAVKCVPDVKCKEICCDCSMCIYSICFESNSDWCVIWQAALSGCGGLSLTRLIG